MKKSFECLKKGLKGILRRFMLKVRYSGLKGLERLKRAL